MTDPASNFQNKVEKEKVIEEVKVEEKKVVDTTVSTSTSEKNKLPSPFILSVEGVPMVCKELFLNSCIVPVMKEFEFKTIFIQEPVTNSKNTQILASNDSRRWLYSHQLSILRDKFALYKRALDHSKNGLQEVILLERSLLGDNIFAQAHLESENITEVEMDELDRWHELCELIFPMTPHLCFHLKANMTILEEKLAKELPESSVKPVMKFYETLELMHSVNFKIIAKKSVKIVVIKDMELFDENELIKNKILKEVRDAIITHEFLKERI